METVRTFNPEDLRFEYGLDGVRLLPWTGLTPPFGGAYCIVRPHTDTTEHVNSPADEEELFIGISGNGLVIVGNDRYSMKRGDIVFIPRGVRHFVRNENAEPFHFYTLWWNRQTAREYLGSRGESGGRLDWDI